VIWAVCIQHKKLYKIGRNRIDCSHCVQVKLLRQLQEEAQKSRQSEQKNRKTIMQLQKQQQAKESKIKSLESEKNRKELILKRKMEEVLCSICRKAVQSHYEILSDDGDDIIIMIFLWFINFFCSP